ncbi:MAG: hypothetical protein ACR2FN_00030 [Chitinophagaceae bacterium]
MKTLPILCMLIIESCNNILQIDDSIQSFIPGTYVKYLEGEYSIGHDTLIITKSGKQANTYIIDRHLSYQRIIEHKLRPAEYKTEQWIAIYNPNDKVLYEQKQGTIISFLPEKNMLLLGSSDYKKLNK